MIKVRGERIFFGTVENASTIRLPGCVRRQFSSTARTNQSGYLHAFAADWSASSPINCLYRLTLGALLYKDRLTLGVLLYKDSDSNEMISWSCFWNLTRLVCSWPFWTVGLQKSTFLVFHDMKIIIIHQSFFSLHFTSQWTEARLHKVIPCSKLEPLDHEWMAKHSEQP